MSWRRCARVAGRQARCVRLGREVAEVVGVRGGGAVNVVRETRGRCLAICAAVVADRRIDVAGARRPRRALRSHPRSARRTRPRRCHPAPADEPLAASLGPDPAPRTLPVPPIGWRTGLTPTIDAARMSTATAPPTRRCWDRWPSPGVVDAATETGDAADRAARAVRAAGRFKEPGEWPQPRHQRQADRTPRDAHCTAGAGLADDGGRRDGMGAGQVWLSGGDVPRTRGHRAGQRNGVGAVRPAATRAGWEAAPSDVEPSACHPPGEDGAAASAASDGCAGGAGMPDGFGDELVGGAATAMKRTRASNATSVRCGRPARSPADGAPGRPWAPPSAGWASSRRRRFHSSIRRATTRPATTVAYRNTVSRIQSADGRGKRGRVSDRPKVAVLSWGSQARRRPDT